MHDGFFVRRITAFWLFFAVALSSAFGFAGLCQWPSGPECSPAIILKHGLIERIHAVMPAWTSMISVLPCRNNLGVATTVFSLRDSI